jgi:glycosyltransferase involved in cell wall biosynthesis
MSEGTVTISCSVKLHAFALAEQMAREHLLENFYTTYSSEKNTFLKNFAHRNDHEIIPVEKIKTMAGLAFPLKLWQSRAHIWNNFFDEWVAYRIRNSRSRVFIGWSGMSLHSIRAAKRKGMTTILERGSSHILYQDRILQEEYRRFGKKFSVHPYVIKKELLEYQEADFISIPSTFVKNTFLEEGIDENKLFVNVYGAGDGFQRVEKAAATDEGKFRIIYLGRLSIQKGLIYLFEALRSLSIPESKFEVWFIGGIDDEFKPYCEQLRQANWTFFGHLDHNALPAYLAKGSVGVFPSIQDGFGMVILQMLAAGLPVIATMNTGGQDVIENGKNGFIIPIRSSESIKEKLEYLFFQRDILRSMSITGREVINQNFSWDSYGKRYSSFIKDHTDLQ